MICHGLYCKLCSEGFLFNEYNSNYGSGNDQFFSFLDTVSKLLHGIFRVNCSGYITCQVSSEKGLKRYRKEMELIEIEII